MPPLKPDQRQRRDLAPQWVQLLRPGGLWPRVGRALHSFSAGFNPLPSWRASPRSRRSANSRAPKVAQASETAPCVDRLRWSRAHVMLSPSLALNAAPSSCLGSRCANDIWLGRLAVFREARSSPMKHYRTSLRVARAGASDPAALRGRRTGRIHASRRGEFPQQGQPNPCPSRAGRRAFRPRRIRQPLSRTHETEN